MQNVLFIKLFTDISTLTNKLGRSFVAQHPQKKPKIDEIRAKWGFCHTARPVRNPSRGSEHRLLTNKVKIGVECKIEILRLANSPFVVLEGVGILLAPVFLRERRTYDLEAVKEALGIFLQSLGHFFVSFSKF